MSRFKYPYQIILHHGKKPNSKPEFCEGRIAMHVTDRMFYVSRSDGVLEEIPFDSVPTSLCDALVDGWFLFGKPVPEPETAPNLARSISLMNKILKKVGLV
jgi:hypothetical protein